uniref:Putative transcription regulator n=1 Tax=uncultured bacterium Contig1522a TaxID=1393448 RepID=W0FMB0_9BACT|nr:putative transcription regulator [uncultured bacterium Contig1522a]
MISRQLETFVKTADAGSFGKAADSLYISTPAVVQQINLLEDSLGFRVFERSNRGVKLTPAGRSLYEDAKTLLRLADDAVKKARRIAESGDTAVRIGTSLLYKCRMLPDLWTRVSEYCPDLKIEIVPMREYDSRDNVFSKLGRDFDLFEGIYASAWKDSCRFLELSRTPICCAVARNHRLAGKSRLTADDLDGETLVMPPEGVSAELDDFRKTLLAAHPTVKVTESAYYGVDTFTLCEMTTYILVTQPVYADIHPGLKTIPLDMEREFTVPYGLMIANDPSPAVKRFISAIERVEGIRPHNGNATASR